MLSNKHNDIIYKIKKNAKVKLNSNYVSSNMSCNFGKNSGCVCLSKDNFNYLENHGNNKSKCLNN